MSTHTNKANKIFKDRYEAVCRDLDTLRGIQKKVDAQIEDVQRTKYALERAIETLLPGVTEEQPEVASAPMPKVEEDELDQKEMAASFRREMEAAAE